MRALLPTSVSVSAPRGAVRAAPRRCAPGRAAAALPASRGLRVRAAAADGGGGSAAELEQFRAALAQDLKSKTREWNEHQSAGGGVASAGVDVGVAAGAQSGAELPELTELKQDTFYPALEAAGDKLVIVDFFTDWCGPCKVIAPRLRAMAAQYASAGVLFYKFNCNKENKELGKKLAIKVAPTFHLYRKSELLATLTGAKPDELEALLLQHKK